jgi:cytochrome b561
MGNRSAGYWICFLLAVAAATAGFVMMRSPDAHTHELGRYLGFGAIALLLIGRFVFRRPTPPTPPMPKD